MIHIRHLIIPEWFVTVMPRWAGLWPWCCNKFECRVFQSHRFFIWIFEELFKELGKTSTFLFKVCHILSNLWVVYAVFFIFVRRTFHDRFALYDYVRFSCHLMILWKYFIFCWDLDEWRMNVLCSVYIFLKNFSHHISNPILFKPIVMSISFLLF